MTNHRISNMSSLVIKISSEKAMELQLNCENHHKTTFSKFESFGCAFQGAITDTSVTFRKVLLDSDRLSGRW